MTEAFIEEQVSKVTGVSVEDIYLDTRKRHIVQARMLCMYFIYYYLRRSECVVGKRYDRDHSTVCHAKKTVNNLLQTNKDFKRIYSKIESVLKEYRVKSNVIVSDVNLLKMAEQNTNNLICA